MGAKYTDAQKRAQQKYQATRSIIKTSFSKEDADDIRSYASAIGMTVSDLLIAALTEYRKNHPVE